MHHSIRRRDLLGVLTAAAGASFLPRVLLAQTGGPSRLVIVILRGALDGLAAVPPYADPDYASLHRDLAIAPPGKEDGALKLDAHFGLHPSLAFLHESHGKGELVVFQAVASPYRDRSHFDGQNVLENGLDKPVGAADGWLNRALVELKGSVTERAVAISQNVPLILRGEAAVISKSPQLTQDMDEDLLMRLSDLYSKDDWFSARLSEAVQTERMADSARDEGAAMQSKGGADKVNPVAHMAASLMRAPEGPNIAVFEASGWDTHANQGGAKGTLAGRLSGLDRALKTLSDELGPLWPKTAVLVVTEFGRTAAMNGTRGTDHGTGGCAFLVGGAVSGGRVVTDWPGLSRTALLEGRDLRPTLDLRSVFKGVLAEHLKIGAQTLSNRIFPDSSGARPLQGLIRA